MPTFVLKAYFWTKRFNDCPHQMSLPTNMGRWDPSLIQYEFLEKEVLACNMKTSHQPPIVRCLKFKMIMKIILKKMKNFGKDLTRNRDHDSRSIKCWLRVGWGHRHSIVFLFLKNFIICRIKLLTVHLCANPIEWLFSS